MIKNVHSTRYYSDHLFHFKEFALVDEWDFVMNLQPLVLSELVYCSQLPLGKLCDNFWLENVYVC